MNIIICGSDKSGKSTICADIRESLYPVIPVTIKLTKKPSDDKLFTKEMAARLYRELIGQTQNPLNKDLIFLFDRCYPSEMVYSFKRGYEAMDSEDYLVMDHSLADDQQTLLIYCEADVATLKKRFVTEKEEYLKDSEVERVLERYEQFLKWTSLPFIRINSLTDRGQNVVAVRKFIDEHK